MVEPLLHATTPFVAVRSFAEDVGTLFPGPPVMVMVTAPPAKEALTVPDGGLKLKMAAEQREWIDTAQTSGRAASLVQSVAKAAVLRHGASGSWIWHFTGKIPVLWQETNT